VASANPTRWGISGRPPRVHHEAMDRTEAVAGRHPEGHGGQRAPHRLAWQRRRIRQLARSDRDLTIPPAELLDALDLAVGFDAWCAGALDPATLLPTRAWGTALPPSRAIALDARHQDPFTVRELAAASPPVRRLSDALASGDGRRSGLAAEHRELLAVHGYAHELRAVLVSDRDAWEFLHLFRRPGRPDFAAAEVGFAAAEVGFVADLVPDLAEALCRWTLASQGCAPRPGDRPPRPAPGCGCRRGPGCRSTPPACAAPPPTLPSRATSGRASRWCWSPHGPSRSRR
jgi:hypothetical protein